MKLLLNVENLEKQFGGVAALDGYNIRIRPGELLGLIGPNGAGKTTVFNLLSGVIFPTSGRIRFDGRDITRLPPHKKAEIGIVRTFQNIRLFKDLSVLDNIRVAFHMRLGCGFWQVLFHTKAYCRAEIDMERRADELLNLFELTSVRDTPARRLSYGIQRRVEIARAMATMPRLLLLDEPSAGLNPKETDELKQSLLNIHKTYDLTLFLIEHDMKLVMSMCRKIQVIHQGQPLALGSPDEVRRDPRVVEAYLGKPGGYA